MKEVYRNPDPIKVSFYKQLLEAEGIATLIRPNVDAMKSGFQTVPLWEWSPSIWVVEDNYHEEAMDIIRKHMAETEELSRETQGTEISCPHCSEKNPGTFAECWSCQKPLHGDPS